MFFYNVSLLGLVGRKKTHVVVEQGAAEAKENIDQAVDEAEVEVVETAAAVEESANWGWLGLLGLFGLLGLAGRKKTHVVEEHRDLKPLDPNEGKAV